MNMKAPASLTSIQPLLTRAQEIKTADPIVSYFCNYLAVQQVLETKLHTTDTEVAELAAELLNEIEGMKSPGGVLDNERAKDILDSDEASCAYILNFATSVFEKACRATEIGKVTMATGTGFAAAAVFLGLEAVWGELPLETSKKIKYSKFQATRILKSIKDGKDPNELYSKDKELTEGSETAEPSEDRSVSAVCNELSAEINDDDVKLPEPPKADPSNDLSLPHTPQDDLDDDIPMPHPPEDEPEGNEEPEVTNTIRTSNTVPGKQGIEPQSKPIIVESSKKQSSNSQKMSTSSIIALTQASGSAQKHAKYAISALNYDDISTAISELEKALSILNTYARQT